LFVFEDAEIESFLNEEFGVGFGVLFRNAEEHEKSRADFSRDGLIDGHACFGYALYYGSHNVRLIL
jgi:hypothetical protein